MSPEIISRPRVFLEVQIGTEPAGRIVIELFSDKTPQTCENFRALCASSYTPPSASKPLTYKLSPFHRIIDEFMIQGGDITAGDGTGGQSIYGGEFADENIGWRNIDKEGLLCMANRGKGTNSSQFFITLAPCEHLNAKHTVFGHVVSGKNVLDRVAKVRVDKMDKPYEAVLVSHCGELERPKPIRPTPSPSRQQPMPSWQRPNGSNDRGRNRAKRSRSPTRSSSATSAENPHDTSRPHQASRPPCPQRKRQARRRSDILVDETRRGRSLTRSQSPPSPSSKAQRTPSPRHHRRKRSPSRSSSHARSRSPHLRRRHTRSRSRSRSRLEQMGQRGEYRRRDEEWILREEAEREGRGRWEGVIEDDGGVEYGGVGRKGGGGYEPGREVRGGRLGEGRLGAENEGAEVKFKGRGSMKYRERRW